jgi:ATP-dependent helicase/nuclease subunit A
MNVPNLTFEQREAILTLDRPLCIRAGAGCGKTGVLAYHYGALLLKKELRPHEIVAVTFTEKAAGELKTRIQKVLREAQEGVLPFQDEINLSPVEITLLLQEIPHAPISTLHGLAARIVRDASLLTGFDPHFEILNENEAYTLKQEALSKSLSDLLEQSSSSLKILITTYGWQNLQRQIRQMLDDWPTWKSLHPSPLTPHPSPDETQLWQALQDVFQTTLKSYESFKKTREALDFNDLEEEAIHLLSTHQNVVRHYRQLWKAFLIDEFQDTSERQDRLISLLLEIENSGIQESKFKNPSPLTPHPSRFLARHLAIVGDEKQSIYSFRGAEPHIFEKFEKKIIESGGRTVQLTHNFRSPPSILAWVNSLFAPLFHSYSPLEATQKEVWKKGIEVLAHRKEKLPAQERRTLEANLLAHRVAKLIEQGVNPHKIFLLFRALTPAPIYLKAFRELKIPVYVKSSESLIERQEILDLIHAMRVVVEPENGLAWVGLLRSPAVGLSDEVLLKQALTSPLSLSWGRGIKGEGSVHSREISPHPNPLPQEREKNLCQSLLQKDKQMGPYEFLEWFLDQTELIPLYNITESLSLKAQNILQFLEWTHHWENHHAGGLEEFLKEWDLLQKNQIRTKSLSDQLGMGEAVTFMTIHQAKGLDFPIVILPDIGSTGSGDRIAIADHFKGEVGLRLPQASEGLKRNFEDSPLLKEIRQAKEKLSAEEEDRIFYVATTRAMEKIIFGFLPPDEKKNSSSHYLSLLNSTLRQRSDVNWIREEPAIKPISESQPLHQRAILKPHTRKKRSHFAVTQLECFLRSRDEYFERYVYQIPARPFNVGATGRSPLHLDPLEKGNLIHETLCLLSRPLQRLKIEDALNTAWNRHPPLRKNKESFDSLLEILSNTLQHPNFQSILDPEEGYSEIPFLLSLPPYEVQGALDRLIRHQQHWRIVDYKTGEQSNAKNFEFQMKTYCLAASKIVWKPVTEAMLYFVEPNLTHTFHFSDQDLKEHKNYLVDLMDEINQTHP